MRRVVVWAILLRIAHQASNFLEAVTTRDDFTPAIKRQLALRAAHRCCNPRCRSLTVKPTADGKTVSLGVAAHVCAAAPGGPRFDPAQTPEERASSDNAIWVCHNCSDRIDKDRANHSEELLRNWRQQHEAWVAEEDFVPGLPKFELSTLGGLSVPHGPEQIVAEDLQRLREHTILIATSSRHEIEQLTIRLQFPEPVAAWSVVASPPGVEVRLRPERSTWLVAGSGSVSITGELPPTANFLIDVERLMPARTLALRLRSVPPRYPDLSIDRSARTDALDIYATGAFLYRDQGQMFERRFIVPFESGDNRSVRSLTPEEDVGTRMLIRAEQFP
jgi:hypothetical protein